MYQLFGFARSWPMHIGGQQPLANAYWRTATVGQCILADNNRWLMHIGGQEPLADAYWRTATVADAYRQTATVDQCILADSNLKLV